jgi:hypothetical protein
LFLVIRYFFCNENPLFCLFNIEQSNYKLRNSKGKIMAKISKSIILPAAAVLCLVLLASRSVGPTAEAQAEQAGQIDKQQQDVYVLVQAFVVEVNLSQLYDQGVSPIGQKPNSVSVENILKCLKTKDIGQVTTGVKVAVNSGQRGEAKIKETIQFKRQLNVPNRGNLPPNVRYSSYDTGKMLAATVLVRPSGEIFVTFEFNQSTYRNIDGADELPPGTVNREWSGAIELRPGRPAIAAATQNEETGVFLILSADTIER